MFRVGQKVRVLENVWKHQILLYEMKEMIGKVYKIQAVLDKCVVLGGWCFNKNCVKLVNTKKTNLRKV